MPQAVVDLGGKDKDQYLALQKLDPANLIEYHGANVSSAHEAKLCVVHTSDGLEHDEGTRSGERRAH